MAGFKSTYLSNAYLNYEFGGVALSIPSSIYVALFTAMPTPAGGGTEPSGNAYARVAVVRNATNFPAPSAQAISNATVIDFGTPTGGGWGTIVGAGWYDASSGGNLLRAGPFSPARVAAAGLDFFVPIAGFIGTEA